MHDYFEYALKVLTSPLSFFVYGVAILVFYMLKSGTNFLNIKKILKDYLLIFSDSPKHLLIFWGVPILFTLAVVQISILTESLLGNIIVFLSILISAFFAMLSILIGKQTKEIESELYKQVLKETASTALLEIILCITALIISLSMLVLYQTIHYWILTLLSAVIYYLIFVMLLNLLILIKRLKALIDNE